MKKINDQSLISLLPDDVKEFYKQLSVADVEDDMETFEKSLIFVPEAIDV